MNPLSGSFPFKILNIEKSLLDRRWNYPNVCSPFFRMFYILNGEGFISHENKEYVLTPDKLILIPNYTNCSYACNNSLEMIYIIFMNNMNHDIRMYNYHNQVIETKGNYADKMLFRRLLAINPHMGLVNYDPKSYDNWNYLDRFKKEEQKKGFQDIIESQGILLQLFSRFEATKNQQLNYDDTSVVRIFKIIQYIQKNLSKNLSVTSLANEICLSPDYFSRLFLQVTQSRPLEFIQRKRIEEAQLLLVTTNYPLNKIAELTGLNNSSYLIRLFKRYTGLAPGKYRLSQFIEENKN